MEPVLRPMAAEDVPAVMALERELFPGDAWSEGMLRDELAQPDRYYLVAETGAPGVAGYAGLRAVPPEGDVQTMAVAPDRWGRGIGRALLAGLLAEAGRRAVTDVFLEVRSDNPRAQDLYRRFGFEEIGVRRGYYAGADAIVMRRLAPEAGRTGS
ncbi:ribosomal protein S18-alanine N-acetyltransferase [Actinorugispora endophytica]|uniref:[Ribosomal protein bS18]-alanine N-acetyltransferase n=1 Tax=Actinorugispora endophytica TaxID=1605990 RepID=A0A4R6V0G8_9ACTN|nr:ribosomal protein S18-alanine N-acetyltransferase [Actinorugispora endophytica]TDQ51425.1 [SSU ribosomal protein S18P]-alanine acetyltransferase [Actinorugispora endophytica]